MILLVGCGSMSVEYSKVLVALEQNFLVIGRGNESALDFTKKTGISVMTGGLENVLNNEIINDVSSAIVAVGVESLFQTAIYLMKNGVKKILIEKPGILYPFQINEMVSVAKEKQAKIFIAYNRRFYSTIKKAKEIILDDGGLTSFTFDFTEWGHEISGLKKAPGVKEYWLLANSTHVIDLAFHVGGVPKHISYKHSGGVAWHQSGSIFVGSGITVNDIPFSYHANWDAPGRWGLEFNTANHKLILRPMEKLMVMSKGSVNISEVSLTLDDLDLDTKYKPGLYNQVRAFNFDDTVDLCSLEEYEILLSYYCDIAGYSKEITN